MRIILRNLRPRWALQMRTLLKYCDPSGTHQVCTLNGKIVFTDVKAGKVKQYNPDDNSVKVLVGSGHNSSSDGTQDSCSFKQIKGICSVDKTLFVTGVSAGKVKIVTRLGETISFLEILGSL